MDGGLDKLCQEPTPSPSSSLCAGGSILSDQDCSKGRDLASYFFDIVFCLNSLYRPPLCPPPTLSCWPQHNLFSLSSPARAPLLGPSSGMSPQPWARRHCLAEAGIGLG